MLIHQKGQESLVELGGQSEPLQVYMLCHEPLGMLVSLQLIVLPLCVAAKYEIPHICVVYIQSLQLNNTYFL